MSQAIDVNKLSHEECLHIIQHRNISDEISFRVLNTIRSLKWFQEELDKDTSNKAYIEMNAATTENSHEVAKKHSKEILKIFDEILKS